MRHEHSEIYTQTGRSGVSQEQTWTSGHKSLGYWLKQSPTSAHTQSLPSPHFNDFLMHSSHVFPLSPFLCSAGLVFWKNAGGGHLPGGHRHWKRLTLSTHCPLFTHGLLWHSFTSSSQCTPLKPAQTDHTRGSGSFRPRKHKCA